MGEIAENSAVIEQQRSRFRLRLTAMLGAGITLASSFTLLWLLGLPPFSTTSERSTIDLNVRSDCPAPINASVFIDASEELVLLRLEIDNIPNNFSTSQQNRVKRDFFNSCSVHITSQGQINQAFVRGSISGDGREEGEPEPKDHELTQFKDKNRVGTQIEIRPHELPRFAGEIQLFMPQLFARDSFGEYHIGADIHVGNDQGIRDLKVGISLPEEKMQALVIRPQPASIGVIPVETYRFEAKSSFDSQHRWVDETFFITFNNPQQKQIREGVLILTSTLFGAGISALLEAFLAGGVSALLLQKKRRKEVSDETD